MKTNGRMKRIPTRVLLLLAGWWLAGTSLAQTTVEYIHTDALGSVVAVTNAAGQVIERNDYEPYGAIIGKPSYGGVGFTGHVQDAVTGLTYMQQRYYDPQLGRFLSIDPVAANSGTGANFNRYWYANNSPYKFNDPDGRLGCTGTHIEGNCADGGLGSAVGAMATSAREYRSAASSERLTLSAVTVDGPTRGERGAVRWEVRWDLNQPSEAGGWVVQQMQLNSGGFYVSGEKEENRRQYWEAWRVEPGQSSATGTDTFRRGPVDSSIVKSMYMTWRGTARFYEGLQLPSSFVWGQVRAAGQMMSTYDDPQLSTDNATDPVVRSLETHFP